MPPKRVEWIDRIRAVEREFTAIHLGTARLLVDARSDPGILTGDALRPRDVEYAAARAEGTYIIRLFAEFETGLRSCWVAVRGNDPPSRARDLIDGIAALRQIPDTHRDGAHDVRVYRNVLVHEREETADILGIADARHQLCRFFSHLSLDW